MIKDRAGKYVSNLSGDSEYKSFRPSPLNSVELEMDSEMISLLVNAGRQLATLDSKVSSISNINLFISMYVRKEALLSSQIEGTQTTLEDVLDPNANVNANRDVSDVVNYVKATEYAIDRLKTLPLCNRLIKETHYVLMQNVRGQDKSPGEFRHSQNWIGGYGSTLKNARYIPPNVADMNECLSDLEKYFHEESELDVLIRAGLIHYQFESIHPFLDGNGRVGRLLITLFLMENGVLSKPALYISYFLKRNRIEYYDRMTDVRKKSNYEQWIKFFLQAIIESSSDASQTIDKLRELHDKYTEVIAKTFTRSTNAFKLFEYLEQSPIIDVTKTANAMGLSFNAVDGLVNKFIDLGILVATSDAKRNKTFAYKEYLDILRDGTV